MNSIKRNLFLLVLAASFSAHAKNGFLDNGAVFSPDGNKIAFHSNRSGHTEIWIMDADGSNLKQVTKSGTNDRWPQFSADGKKLVFMSRQDENWEIYSVNTDGSNRARITQNKVTDLGASFSPDGKNITFTSVRDDESGIADLYILNIDDKIPIKVSENAYWPTWSPDGKSIAYAHIINEKLADVWIYDVENKTAKAITQNSGSNFGAKFSRDSKNIIFFSNRDGKFQIFTMKISGEEQINLKVDTSGDGNPNFSPDGKYILFSNNPNDDADIYLFDLGTGKISNITP